MTIHALNTLPLTIAQVQRRAINAKSAVDRHHLAFFAKEMATEARRKGVLGFFTALVAYRNQVMGHGAQRQRSYYEQVGPLLLDAVMDLFQDQSLLGGLELAVARLTLEADETKTHLSWQILKGLGSLIQVREKGQGLEAELDEKCIPGQVYLMGAGVRIPLFPFVVFVEDDQGGEHVGFLNRTVGKATSNAFLRSGKVQMFQNTPIKSIIKM
ncbi:hypothetical protein ACFL27_06720 [candidate division CSSED10-310 bacterium]|uniref:Uncharacterized protein n=1 Tax=candidate division CSSED10-310 bacterium TaxID=2855610 RepID=A0ABV6YUX2_UNCC1